jgi:hypothetical protein
MQQANPDMAAQFALAGGKYRPLRDSLLYCPIHDCFSTGN